MQGFKRRGLIFRHVEMETLKVADRKVNMYSREVQALMKIQNNEFSQVLKA